MVKEKNAAIEFYRVLFTFLICVQHMQVYLGDIAWIRHAYLGVEFFFILSGYFLYKSYKKQKEPSTTKYFVHRIKRLWPEYFVAALAAIFVFGVHRHNFSLGKAAAELLMFQNTGLYPGNYPYGGYNYPSWYVPVLLFCGALIYSMLSLGERVYKKLAAPLIIVCGYTLIWHMGCGLENWDSAYVLSITMIRGLCAMSIGVLLASVQENKTLSGMSKTTATLLEAGSLALIIFGIFTNYSADIVSIAAFAVLVFVTLEKKGLLTAFLCKQHFWSAIGKYCYSAYLNQAVMILVMYRTISRLGITNPWLCVLIISIVIAAYAFFSSKVIWKVNALIHRKKEIPAK